MKKTNLVTIIDVNTVEQHATKNESKYEKLQTYISKRLSHESIRSPDSSNNSLSPAKSCKKTVKLTKNAYTDKYKYSA